MFKRGLSITFSREKSFHFHHASFPRRFQPVLPKSDSFKIRETAFKVSQNSEKAK